MIHRFYAAVAAGTLVLLLADGAQAQRGAADVVPIEVRTCRFAAGKGPADLDGLATAFNAWMERTRAPSYAAYVLQPQAYSQDVDFDLAWVGQWRDGKSMGESLAHYSANGAELAPVFGSVMSCDSNRNFSVVTLREPAARGQLGPVEVATCTLRLGVTMGDVLPVLDEWVTYTSTVGSTAANWLLFPAYGERSGARYNFKWAVGFESYEAFGRDYDRLMDAESLDKYGELFGGVLQCDSPRLFSVRTIRAPQN